jgi:hypothetical protein
LPGNLRRRSSHVNYTLAKQHKFSGAIVQCVAKLAGINLQKFVSFSYWFDNLGSITEGRLAGINLRKSVAKLAAIVGEKEDFCKGSLSLPIFYFIIVLLYFIFAYIILSKIQKISFFHSCYFFTFSSLCCSMCTLWRTCQ